MPKLVSFIEGSAPVNLLPSPEWLSLAKYIKQVRGYPLSEAYTCKNYSLIYEEVATDRGGLASIFIHIEKQTNFTIHLPQYACALLMFTRGSVVIDFTEVHSKLLFQWQCLSTKQEGKLQLLLLPGSYEMKIIQINTDEQSAEPDPASKQALNCWPEERQILTMPELLINEIRNFEKRQQSATRYGAWFQSKFIPILAAHLQLKTLLSEHKKPWPKDRLELITTYIKQNLCDNITDIGLCTTYYLTEAELEKMFFEQFRCSVRRYLTEQRMKTANEIFYADTCTIAEIASRVGYKQVNTFIADYEDHFGCILPDKEKKKYL